MIMAMPEEMKEAMKVIGKMYDVRQEELDTVKFEMKVSVEELKELMALLGNLRKQKR